MGALIAIGALTLYASTLCRTIYIEDSAEFSTAAAIFGVPHPPGYPLYTLLAGLFVQALPIGDIGFRSNLFSAICGASTVGVLFILLRRLGAGAVAALAATICFAVGPTFWSQCLAAEVHTLNGLLIGLTLLCTFEAVRAPSTRTFALAGLLIGLTIGHRNLNILFLAPLFVLLERASRRSERRASVLAGALAALVAAGLVYIYLPLAARREPALDMGAPVTLRRLYDIISTHTYFRHLATASLTTDLRRCAEFLARLPAELGIALLAAPVGFVVWHRRGEAARWVPIAWMALTCVIFAALYNVLDVESYLIPAYLVLAVAAGVGFEAWSGSKWQVVLPIVALVGVPIGFSSVNLRHISIARDYGRQLIQGAPPRAIVLSFGDTETHVLTYEQAVAHERADVVVVSASEIADWYVEQLSRRHPEVHWPSLGPSESWLADLIAVNQGAHPICLTQPVPIGPASSRLVPTGLLFCLAPRLDAPDLARSVAFWQNATTPSVAELGHRDVHVQMIDFSFALSRFMLAQALAETGKTVEARAQLDAVAAANPDSSENAIVASMRTIGREGHTYLSLGRRAEQALKLDPRDPRFLALLHL